MAKPAKRPRKPRRAEPDTWARQMRIAELLSNAFMAPRGRR